MNNKLIPSADEKMVIIKVNGLTLFGKTGKDKSNINGSYTPRLQSILDDKKAVYTFEWMNKVGCKISRVLRIKDGVRTHDFIVDHKKNSITVENNANSSMAEFFFNKVNEGLEVIFKNAKMYMNSERTGGPMRSAYKVDKKSRITIEELV